MPNKRVQANALEVGEDTEISEIDLSPDLVREKSHHVRRKNLSEKLNSDSTSKITDSKKIKPKLHEKEKNLDKALYNPREINEFYSDESDETTSTLAEDRLSV